MAAKPNFHVDAHFPNSKEMLTMARRHRLPATGAFTAAGCWSCDKLTDGWVPVRALVELLVTPLLTDLLIASTLWIPADDDARGSVAWATQVGPVSAVQFENWERWQITKSKWAKGNRSNAERQASFRDRRSKEFDEMKSRLDNALLKSDGVSGNTHSGNASNALPTSAGEERKGSSSYLGGEGPVGSDPPTPLQEFPDHCPNHQHNPDPPACHPCRKTREANQTRTDAAADAQAHAAADERTQRTARIVRCKLCGPTGWLLDVWGDEADPAIRCQHPGVA